MYFISLLLVILLRLALNLTTLDERTIDIIRKKIFLADCLTVTQPFVQKTDLADVIRVVKSEKRNDATDFSVETRRAFRRFLCHDAFRRTLQRGRQFFRNCLPRATHLFGRWILRVRYALRAPREELSPLVFPVDAERLQCLATVNDQVTEHPRQMIRIITRCFEPVIGLDARDGFVDDIGVRFEHSGDVPEIPLHYFPSLFNPKKTQKSQKLKLDYLCASSLCLLWLNFASRRRELCKVGPLRSTRRALFA